jgi:non-lysosomal glucosylceramidase
MGSGMAANYKLFEPVDGDRLTDAIEENGCLTDQLVGQWAAHFSGIGELLPADHIGVALHTILRRNYERSFGLKNCSFRTDGTLSDVPPDIWNDQANTCWSGVELAFSSLLIYEGMYNEGVAVAKTVDARYRKNGLYWNHQEYGGHYFRPMSAWSIVNALLGFSLQCGRLTFDPQLPKREMRLFFAVPTGTAQYSRDGSGVTVRCLSGNLIANSLRVKNNGTPRILVRGEPEDVSISKKGDWTEISFHRSLLLRAGEALEIDTG